ncbi:uncharacterized protein LOC141651317 [Silene latifolia]|uniref:uncharacterized protein LOC141651317 n=1 Tax=Silene latifolia TaxID=37657 RepID=UPI003D789FD3
MKILSWNCQGLGNPKTVGTLRDWCWRESPNIVFVMETMINARELEKVRNKCGYTSGLCFCISGRSGGLGLWWKDLNIHLVSYDKYHITINVLVEEEEVLWKAAAGVYRWPEQANKYKTWDMMRALCSSNNSVPFILFGDFNEILCDGEKEGGVVRREGQMDAFRTALDDCALVDLGFQSNIFTWQRG